MRWLTLIGASLVTCLAAPAPAHAFKRSTAGAGGPCLFWTGRGHSYTTDSSLDGGQVTPDVAAGLAVDAVNLSLAAWAGAACSDLVFPNLGLNRDPQLRRTGYVAGGSNLNLILWRTANCQRGGAPANDPCQAAGGCGNAFDCWEHGDSVIAVTTTTFDRSTGEIFDADTELNGAIHTDGSRFQFTVTDPGPNVPVCLAPGQGGCVAYDIRNTVTHESGHSLGLDHSADPTATMYAFAPEGDTGKRELHADDLLGICTIYPRGQPTSTCTGAPATVAAGATSGGCGCSPRGTGNGLEALLALATIAGSRTLRRRRDQPLP